MSYACLLINDDHSGVWRNGSASDSRSEGWEFESLCPHLLCPITWQPPWPSVWCERILACSCVFGVRDKCAYACNLSLRLPKQITGLCWKTASPYFCMRGLFFREIEDRESDSKRAGMGMDTRVLIRRGPEGRPQLYVGSGVIAFEVCMSSLHDDHSGVWRNGSASDSRSEGWEFESLCPHLLCPITWQLPWPSVWCENARACLCVCLLFATNAHTRAPFACDPDE